MHTAGAESQQAAHKACSYYHVLYYMLQHVVVVYGKPGRANLLSVSPHLHAQGKTAPLTTVMTMVLARARGQLDFV